MIKNEGFLIFRANQFLKKNILKFRKEIDKLIDKEGDKGGWEGKKKYYKKGKLFEPGTNRLGNLIEKNLLFSKLILIPEILASAKEVIKDEIKVCGLNYREPKLKQEIKKSIWIGSLENQKTKILPALSQWYFLTIHLKKMVPQD